MLIVLLIGQNIQQVSDFQAALETSEKEFPLNEILPGYTTFSNWAIFPLYLKLMRHICGNEMIKYLIINALICSISSVLVYVLCRLCMNSNKISYMAALFYTFWPAHILYVVILTPEFPYIFLMLLSLVLLRRASTFCNKKICYTLIALSGAVFSLSGFFKSTDKIILIDVGIVFSMFLLKKCCLTDCNVRKYLKGFLLFIFVYILSAGLIYKGLDYAYATTINRNPSMHFIYIGLNPYTFGTWNEKSGHIYMQNVIDCNYDFRRADKLTFQTLMSQIEEQNYLNGSYFIEKFKVAWQDNAEIGLIEWSLPENHPFLQKGTWQNSCFAISQAFWVLICLLMCAKAIYLFKDMDEFRLFLCLLMVGFSVLMLIIEVQPRYKCVFYPYMAMLAADGLYNLSATFTNIRRKGWIYLLWNKKKLRTK